MPRHLVLHIGLPKTGTTSIQRVLITKRDDLREQGYFYPRVKEGGVPQFLHKVERGGRAVQFWRELKAEIDDLPQDVSTVILSNEQCSVAFRDTKLIGSLHDRLADRFTSIRVAVYLRRQDLHAASVFAQRLRTGRQVAPPDLASFAAEMAPFHDYEALLSRWAEVFGEAAMMPRIYARDCLPGGDVVRDFLELCGLDAEWAAQRSALQVNPSMNMEGQAMLVAIGRWEQQQPKTSQMDAAEWAELATMITRCCRGRGWRPHQVEAAAYLAHFTDSNEAVRRRWFPERATLFDTDMRDLPETPLVFPEHPAPESAYAVIVDALRVMQEKSRASAKQERRQDRRSKRAQRSARKAGKISSDAAG